MSPIHTLKTAAASPGLPTTSPHDEADSLIAAFFGSGMIWLPIALIVVCTAVAVTVAFWNTGAKIDAAAFLKAVADQRRELVDELASTTEKERNEMITSRDVPMLTPIESTARRQLLAERGPHQPWGRIALVFVLIAAPLIGGVLVLGSIADQRSALVDQHWDDVNAWVAATYDVPEDTDLSGFVNEAVLDQRTWAGTIVQDDQLTGVRLQQVGDELVLFEEATYQELPRLGAE